MIDFPKKVETYEMHYTKSINKQLAIASCLDELKGNEPIDQSLEEKLRQCVYKSFNMPELVAKRVVEMFPDMRITESKL